MILFFGVLTTAMSVLFGIFLDSYLTKEHESKAQAIARSVAESDLETVLDRDATAIQAMIDRYLAIAGVSYVVVSDRYGETMAHTFVPIVPDELEDVLAHSSRAGISDQVVIYRELALGDGKEYLHIAQPILSGVGGYVHIGMDRGVIRDSVHRAIMNQVLVTLAIFFSAVIIGYLFTRSISRPLT
ncbi:MAG: diguanylate cyclase, partial [Desulfovibrio sp.]